MQFIIPSERSINETRRWDLRSGGIKAQVAFPNLDLDRCVLGPCLARLINQDYRLRRQKKWLRTWIILVIVKNSCSKCEESSFGFSATRDWLLINSEFIKEDSPVCLTHAIIRLWSVHVNSRSVCLRDDVSDLWTSSEITLLSCQLWVRWATRPI